MKFKVTVAISFGDEAEDPEHPFDRMYDCEIEAETDLQACDIAVLQTRRLYPQAVIVTTVKEL